MTSLPIIDAVALFLIGFALLFNSYRSLRTGEYDSYLTSTSKEAHKYLYWLDTIGFLVLGLLMIVGGIWLLL